MPMTHDELCTHAVLLTSADPLLLDQPSSWKIARVAASVYSASATAYLLCSLTWTNFHACPADWSPRVLWHAPSVSQSNTNIDNQAKPIRSVLKGLWWSKMKESIISLVSSSAAVIWPFHMNLWHHKRHCNCKFYFRLNIVQFWLFFRLNLRGSPIIELVVCDR